MTFTAGGNWGPPLIQSSKLIHSRFYLSLGYRRVCCLHAVRCALFPQVRCMKTNYKGGDRGSSLTFPAMPDSSGAAPHKGYHAEAQKKNHTPEIFSLLDAEGLKLPFKVRFVLFVRGKNDSPFKLLVWEWNKISNGGLEISQQSSMAQRGV